MQTIQLLIGRYYFGREIKEETMVTVNIRYPNQVTKGIVADATRSRVHPGSHD